MKIKDTDVLIVHADAKQYPKKARARVMSVSKLPKGTDEENRIRLSCADCLQRANRSKFKSIVLLPSQFRQDQFPVLGVAKIMTQEVLKFLRENKTSIKKIIFCLEDQKTYRVFKKAVEGYIEHLLYKLTEGPFVTVDAIIEYKNGLVLIERSNPPYGWALPGGFVDYGESLEEAVSREAKEETHMVLKNLRQFHTYSKPGRDPRFHTITTVFIAKGIGKPKFGDDAKGLKLVKYPDLFKLKYAFDHKNVIKEYLTFRATGRYPRNP